MEWDCEVKCTFRLRVGTGERTSPNQVARYAKADATALWPEAVEIEVIRYSAIRPTEK